MGGYDMVHFDDLAYVASAHQERKEPTSSQSPLRPHGCATRECPSKLLLVCFSSSVENRGVWDDRVPGAEQRRQLAVAPDVVAASLQELQARLRNQHTPAAHVRMHLLADSPLD